MDPLILIVEDDPSLREVLRLGLEQEGYRVTTATDGKEALRAFAAGQPDLVLLDIMLPGMDGFAVCREIRKTSLVPVIMLTARSSTVDVVVGLESGADDYVTKPFEFPELVARTRSVLRRTSVRSTDPDGVGTSTPAADTPSQGVQLGRLYIDPVAHTVHRGPEELALTVTEFKLLYELARHAGQTLTRDQLLELVWGYSYLGDSRLVDVHVQRLRAKIEDEPGQPQLIVTVRGVGYRAGHPDG